MRNHTKSSAATHGGAPKIDPASAAINPDHARSPHSLEGQINSVRRCERDETELSADAILVEIIANLGCRSQAERDAIRYVQSGTLDRYKDVVHYFVDEVLCNARERQRTVDLLQAMAMYFGLTITIGNDAVQEILSRAFSGQEIAR